MLGESQARAAMTLPYLQRLVEEHVLYVAQLGAEVGLDRFNKGSRQLIVDLFKAGNYLLILLSLP
jgi:hypothetical protein